MPSDVAIHMPLRSCTLAPLPRPYHPHSLVVTRSRYRLVYVQVSNGHGWHGVRKMARANEQQKQQEKQQQKQKLKHKQQQQKLEQQQKQKQKQQQEQQQKQKGKQEQQQNGAGETGALSVDGVKARKRTPTIFARNLL